jgi:hypothetical protein
MVRVVINPAVPDRASLDIGDLRARWHTVLRRRAPPHLPRHLLFRILAYRLQADRLGELDAGSRRLLDRIGSGSSEGINRLVADFNRPRTEVRPGTLLTREWDGHLQRVMVLADGFSWNGKTYPSLSKVAFAMMVALGVNKLRIFFGTPICGVLAIQFRIPQWHFFAAMGALTVL